MHKESDAFLRRIIISDTDNKCVWEQWWRNSWSDQIAESITDFE